MLALLLALWVLAQDTVSVPVWLAGIVGLTPASVVLLLWWRVGEMEKHLTRFREEHREDLGRVWGAIEKVRGGN